jgi:hypothetical protein
VGWLSRQPAENRWSVPSALTAQVVHHELIPQTWPWKNNNVDRVLQNQLTWCWSQIFRCQLKSFLGGCNEPLWKSTYESKRLLAQWWKCCKSKCHGGKRLSYHTLSVIYSIQLVANLSEGKSACGRSSDVMTFASSFRDPNNRSITFGTTGDVIMKSGLALRCLIVDSNTSFRIKSRAVEASQAWLVACLACQWLW